MSIAQNLAEQERKAAGGQGSAPKQQKKKPSKKAKLAESPPQAEPPPKPGAIFIILHEFIHTDMQGAFWSILEQSVVELQATLFCSIQ